MLDTDDPTTTVNSHEPVANASNKHSKTGRKRNLNMIGFLPVHVTTAQR
jgi:hypothetical protein